MKNIKLLAIDLAKEVFQLHGVDAQGSALLKKKVKRSELLGMTARLDSGCVIAMEACAGAHFWSREFTKQGHCVRLIAPQFVKPFVKSNKNDAADAEAIAEAASRPSMRFVPVKQAWQQDIQALHRVRSRLVRNRTALSNEIRALLHEYGVVISRGFSQLKQLEIRIEKAEISASTRVLISSLLQELRETDSRLEGLNQCIQQIATSNEAVKRIQKIKGIGPITATAIYSAIGENSGAFKNGRSFAAWLGLVPKQHSSGGKATLLGISKRGDTYLRSLLVHGARSVIRSAKRIEPRDRTGQWVLRKCETRGFNKACVALANKNARVIWALLAKGTEYELKPA